MPPARLRTAAGALLVLVALVAGGCSRGGSAAGRHLDLAAATAYHRAHGGDGLLILQAGTVVAQVGAQQRHRLASGTKSVAGLLALFAVQDGLLALDDPASRFLPEWAGDGDRSRITVRMLLTQSDGLDPGDAAATDATSDTFAAALARPVRHPPGRVFDYGPAHFDIFGLVLRRALDQRGAAPQETVIAYAKRHLFAPLGITDLTWKTDAVGHPLLASGLQLSPAEWAKVGELVLGRGTYGGRSLLPVALVDQLSAPSVATPTYGLSWWLNRPGADRGTSIDVTEGKDPFRQPSIDPTKPTIDPLGPGDLFMAAGAGFQRLYVIPSLRVVVARTGEAGGFVDPDFLRALLRQS